MHVTPIGLGRVLRPRLNLVGFLLDLAGSIYWANTFLRFSAKGAGAGFLLLHLLLAWGPGLRARFSSIRLIIYYLPFRSARGINFP